MARLHQQPPSALPQKRLPRPDDPIPRKPPAFFIRDLKRTGSIGAIGGKELKRVASSSVLSAGPSKKPKVVDDVAEGDAMFKIPELPKKATIKAKGKGKEKDVFGEVDEVEHVPITEAKGKKDEQKFDGVPMTVDENTLEKANKNVSTPLLGSVRDLNGRPFLTTPTGNQACYNRIPRTHKRSNRKMHRQGPFRFQGCLWCYLPRSRVCSRTFFRASFLLTLRILTRVNSACEDAHMYIGFGGSRPPR